MVSMKDAMLKEFEKEGIKVESNIDWSQVSDGFVVIFCSEISESFMRADKACCEADFDKFKLKTRENLKAIFLLPINSRLFFSSIVVLEKKSTILTPTCTIYGSYRKRHRSRTNSWSQRNQCEIF